MSKSERAQKAHNLPSFFYRFLNYPETGAIIGAIILFAFFSFASKKFMTFSNLAGMLAISAEIGIIAIGMTYLIISGEFDLSVGSIFAVGAMCFTHLANAGLNTVVVFFVTLGLCAFLGFVNGIITIKTGIPSFLVTLGTMMLYRGVLLAITRGYVVSYKADVTLINVLGGKFVEPFYNTVIWFIILTLVFSIILTQTQYGNWIFATGGNKETAKAMGINTDRVKLINFTLSGVLSGFSSCAHLSRLLFANPTLGVGRELEAIAAATIGGALLSGGYGSVIGTFIGSLIIGASRNGLVLMGVPGHWYQGLVGLVLLITVAINNTLRKRIMRV